MKVALSYPPNAESVSGCSILPLAGRAMTKTHRNRERAGCLASLWMAAIDACGHGFAVRLDRV
jgi:hypothetical protein